MGDFLPLIVWLVGAMLWAAFFGFVFRDDEKAGAGFICASIVWPVLIAGALLVGPIVAAGILAGHFGRKLSPTPKGDEHG